MFELENRKSSSRNKKSAGYLGLHEELSYQFLEGGQL